MSRKGNPYDNAFAENFMKTMKTEEAYAGRGPETASLLHCVSVNQKRLHASLGYRPLSEYEAMLKIQNEKNPCLIFLT